MKSKKVNKWDKFWQLEIIDDWWYIIENSWRKRLTLICKCSCWNIKQIRKSSVVNWHIRSCWCMKSISKNPKYKWFIKLLFNIRTSNKYKKWRTKCFERDNYTCQISWEKWWKLVVHHLYPFNEIVKTTTLETYNNCEKLWDLSNWITITEKLHKKFHKKYWVKWFDENDFYDFID